MLILSMSSLGELEYIFSGKAFNCVHLNKQTNKKKN